MSKNELNALRPFFSAQEWKAIQRLGIEDQQELHRLINTEVQERLGYNEWLKEVTPTFTWDWAYQTLIQREVEGVITGATGVDRLQLSVPPRHGKSEMVTVRAPAWVLENDPSFRWIIGAYSQTLADKFSRKTRRICESRGVQISSERRAVDDWETTTDPVPGGLRAAGVGGGITGMGANGIIIDDPVKSREEANSPAYRNKAYDWYTDDLLTRLEPDGFIIVIMTRWHQDDLAGRLQKEQGLKEDGGEWTVINLPSLAESNDILGRKPGEALCPERYDEVALARIKKALKESFYALFQGRPVAAAGNIVKRRWIKYYSAPPSPSDTLMVVQSWDTASKTTEISAYSVCTTWAITRTGVYLLDVYRDHLAYPDLKRTAKSMAARYPVGAVLIEDKSSGQSLIQDLKDSTSIPVVPIEPEGDKVMRLYTETATYESGQVYHPESAPWLAEYEAELTSFPLAPDADQVDSTSQFLRWARKRMWTFSWDSTGTRAAQDASDGFGSITGGNDFGGYL